MSNSNGFPSRRALLQNAALMTLAGPVIRAYAAPAATPVRRMITFFHPTAIDWPSYSARGNSNTDFALGRSLKPLEPVKSKVLIVDSPDRLQVAKSGRLSIMNMHFQGHGAMFTGTALQTADFSVKGSPIVGNPVGVSIDIHCANKLHQAGQRAIQFGVNSQYKSRPTLTGMSHPGNGGLLPAVNSPLQLFDELFKGLVSPGGNSDDAKKKAAEIRARKLSMLDNSTADFGVLGRMLGKDARAKLEQDLQAFRELEMVVKNEVSVDPTQFDLKRSDFENLNIEDVKFHLLIAKRQMDILVAALRADITRFSSLQFLTVQASRPVLWMPNNANGTAWNGAGKDYHGQITHYTSDPVELNKSRVADMVKVWADQMMYLVNALKNSPEIDGSDKKIFDNTAIVWTSEMDEIEHKHVRTPYTIVGDMGGALKTGAHIKTTRSCADFLLTLAVAAGASKPTDKFGWAPACTGVIPEMLT
jgi:Protein of unknown function (DUF1552)